MVEIKVKTELKLNTVKIDLNKNVVEAQAEVLTSGMQLPYNSNVYSTTFQLTPELLKYIIENIEKYMGEVISSEIK